MKLNNTLFKKGGYRMKGERFFKIPDDDQEVMVKIVEAIPSKWSWVDGYLHAPKELINSGIAKENTGFSLSRFHSIKPTIIGNYKIGGVKIKPDLYAIMVEQKLPGFISFNEAGYEEDIITFDFAKRITAGFLRKGYRGGLYFFMDCHDNKKYNNPAKCDIVFNPWRGAPIFGNEAGQQPARVRLVWESEYSGKEEDIMPIIAVCHSLNLCEYTPAASEKYSVLQT